MPGKDAIAVPVALGVYLSRIVPAVRRELGRWHAEADSIPDPLLRGQALGALEGKGLNVEATAVFAILAPRSTRPTAIRAMVALQVAVDYLDTLGEQLSPGDSGYLDRLFGSYWESARELPSHGAVSPALERAVSRCGEGQAPPTRPSTVTAPRSRPGRASRTPRGSTAGGRSRPGPAPRSRRTR